ncbi:MAG: SUMF1/EgtB/PvdO family nonheme iron enzyme [Myxococcales bacterium]|nr:SUMF1/EgtB/PvdO family nonheme iron enzyme [Myxococcales bacterium]
MRGKLLGQSGPVKRAAPGALFLGVSALIGAAVGAMGCGPPPPKARPKDTYQRRITNCIGAVRNLADAAQTAMVTIPAGPATLGSTEAERGQARRDYGPGGNELFRDEQEAKQHPLSAFRIDPTPVTNAAYAEFVEACGALPPDGETITPAFWQAQRERYGLAVNYPDIQRFVWPGRLPERSRARHPAVLVTQDEAAFYCAWRGGRLPTEAEWERAARGPGGYVYPWGNRYDPFRVYSRARGATDTNEVGVLTVGDTPEGVHDMGGHVFEWTSTRYPGRKGAFVVKGNGFGLPGGFGRGAARLPRSADIRDIRLGFRCAG